MQLTGHINEDVVMALYLGNLSGEAKQRLDIHISDCPNCFREYKIHREVLSGVETLVKETTNPQYEENFRASIKYKMRKRQIYYDLTYHPIVGPAWIAASDKGVCLIKFSDHTPFEIEELLRECEPEAWIIQNKTAMSKNR